MADEITPDSPPAPAPKNKGGRPRKVVAGLRAPVQQQTRDADIVHHNKDGKVRAAGRDGEWLSRKRPANQDQFYIPPNLIPPGWDYQWNTVTVHGMEQVAIQLAMAENGWRPVPAGRHEGMFMPKGYPKDGAIIRDGLRLEERPMVLTQEAKAEEASKAGRQMKEQQEQLGLVQKLPSGFSRDNPNLKRMERQGTSREWAPAPDIARPQLPIEE
jgi:hypothetical protein